MKPPNPSIQPTHHLPLSLNRLHAIYPPYFTCRFSRVLCPKMSKIRRNTIFLKPLGAENHTTRVPSTIAKILLTRPMWSTTSLRPHRPHGPSQFPTHPWKVHSEYRHERIDPTILLAPRVVSYDLALKSKYSFVWFEKYWASVVSIFSIKAESICAKGKKRKKTTTIFVTLC